MSEPAPRRLSVQIAPWGPDQPTVDAALRAMLQQDPVRAYLRDTQHRLLSFQLLEPETKTIRPVPPRGYRATVFDYTNNRALVVEGQLDEPGRLRVSPSGSQPLPSPDEFDAAVEVLRGHPELGAAIRAGRLQPYPAMPPLVDAELPDGRVERTLAVGLLPRQEDRDRERRDGGRHEIVGVNMLRRTVSRFDAGAPAMAEAHNPICGIPYTPQGTTSSAAGQVRVTVRQGGTVLWTFRIVRPAASSGTNGSGVELRYVDYRGKRVLYRAHVPILNVKYEPGGCGPYRDWQNQEGMLQATGADVAPGFRLCPAPAQTILDSGSDAGNFLGVAVYVQGLEVVVVSEMQAGWYRYISEWRLHADGTIRPRFGFSAVSNSCVCTTHHHHVYWRFDFDVRTAGNNRVREFNDPPLVGGANWHTKSYEIRRPRDYARRRRWRVEHTASGEGYDVVPGPDDGVATASPDWPFPRGDVWVLRYRGSELDDGVVATGPPYEADIDRFKNGEPVDDHDVVLWYGAHFTHDVASEPPGVHGHRVGPDLRPVGW